MNKPTYLIIYKNEEWKKDFIKKRLLRFIDNLDETNDLKENNGFDMKFKHFDIKFIKIYDLEKLNGFRAFGVIIEDSVEINNEQINGNLVPMIDNPFIGAVSRMK